MKLLNIQTGLFFSAAAALGMMFSPAMAEYPERAVTIVVGSVPGSGPDVLARSMAEEFGDALGQPVVIENMPGAAGNVAAGRGFAR